VITEGNWQSHHDAIVAEAQYLQQQSIVIDEFQIGNEFEGALTSTITSLSQTAGTATVVTSGNHNFSDGESVTIFNTNPAAYSGTFSITKINATTFTFAIDSGTSSPATATGANATTFGTCYSLTIPQINAKLRQLATDVKAVYTLGQVSYGCFNNQINGGTRAYDDWIANGLGSLDTLSIHPYGNVNLATISISNGGYAYIAEMVTAFGSRVYISEFNIDASSTNNSGITEAKAMAWMQSFWTTIVNSGIQKALIYEWCEYLSTLKTDYGYSQLRPDGSLHTQWFIFFSGTVWRYSQRVNSVIRQYPTRSNTTRSQANRSYLI
jgi:hypothetical protein